MSVEQTRQRLEELVRAYPDLTAESARPCTSQCEPCTDDLLTQYMLHREWLAWHYAMPDEALALATFNLAIAVHADTGAPPNIEPSLEWMPRVMRSARSADDFQTLGGAGATGATPLWTAQRYSHYLQRVPADKLQQHAKAAFKDPARPDAEVPLKRLAEGRGWFPAPPKSVVVSTVPVDLAKLA